MEISKTINKQWLIALLIIGLVALGTAWRLMPHMPNFAPIGAIALIGTMVLGWRKSLILTLSIMLITDLSIGFYSGFEWTWLGFGLIVILGAAIKKLPPVWRVPLGALGASLLFFVVSNFGVWVASGMYEHTLAGLIRCFVMALPFLKATVLSDIFFGSVLIGSYHLVNAYLQSRDQKASVGLQLSVKAG